MLEIHTAGTKEEAAALAAQSIINYVNTKPNAVLGLATGNTMVGVYDHIAKSYDKGEVSFKEVRSVNLDEYVGIEKEDDRSFAYFMKSNLFDRTDINMDNTYIPSGTAPDSKQEALDYQQTLAKLGRRDIQLLGIGLNGHIGFNEPAAQLTAGTHVVTLTENTKEANAPAFGSPDLVPDYALTMGIAEIMQAERIILVALGAGKAEIMKAALQGPITTDVPASLLQLHPHVEIYVDADAAKYL